MNIFIVKIKTKDSLIPQTGIFCVSKAAITSVLFFYAIDFHYCPKTVKEEST